MTKTYFECNLTTQDTNFLMALIHQYVLPIDMIIKAPIKDQFGIGRSRVVLAFMQKDQSFLDWALGCFDHHIQLTALTVQINQL